MKYALNLSLSDSRILSATYEKYGSSGQPIVDGLPEGNICDYRYINGEYLYDPIIVPEPEPEVNTEDLMLDLMADHEYRLCLIELGII